MTLYEKEQFIKRLCDFVKQQLLRKVKDAPEEWDGHELRRWISDRFKQVVMPMPLTRAREYENTIRTSNLLI